MGGTDFLITQNYFSDNLNLSDPYFFIASIQNVVNQFLTDVFIGNDHAVSRDSSLAIISAAYSSAARICSLVRLG